MTSRPLETVSVYADLAHFDAPRPSHRGGVKQPDWAFQDPTKS